METTKSILKDIRTVAIRNKSGSLIGSEAYLRMKILTSQYLESRFQKLMKNQLIVDLENAEYGTEKNTSAKC